MSALIQQEDALPQSSDNAGNAASDAAGVSFDDNLHPNAQAGPQQSSTIDADRDIPKSMTPEMSVKKSEENTPDEIQCADSIIKCEDSIDDNILETVTLAQLPMMIDELQDEVDNKCSKTDNPITTNEQCSMEIENTIKAVESNQSSAVKTILNLEGTVNETNDATNVMAQEISQNNDQVEQLIKKTINRNENDSEYTDAEAKAGCNSEAVNAIVKEEAMDVDIPLVISEPPLSPSLADNKIQSEFIDDNTLETVTTGQISMKMEPQETVQKDCSNTDIKKCSINIEISPEDIKPQMKETVSDPVLNLDQKLGIVNEKADETNDVTDTRVKQISLNNELETLPSQELINPVQSGPESTDAEPQVECNLDAVNMHGKPIDVDIPLIKGQLLKSKSNITCVNDEVNIVEEDKISEIDIDETIVDLKHLIDQDEDTIKQLGLDVGQSDSENKHTSKIIAKKSKSDGEFEQADLVRVGSESAKTIDSDVTKSVKDINDQPINEVITYDIKNIVAGNITDKSLDTSLGELPTNPKEEVTKLALKSEGKDITVNSRNLDINDTFDNVSNVVIAKIDIETGNSKSCKETIDSKEKEILQTLKEKVEILHEIGSGSSKEIYKNDKMGDNSESQTQKDKGDSKNAFNITPEALNDQQIENAENYPATKIQKVSLDEDNNKSPEKPKEDLDDNTAAKKAAEEFITPDITNDAIKINTEHRINRPDVMLDIPSQEFDLDEFDETTESQSGNTDENESDLTAKTVSEIVNQLAKETENMDTDEVMNNDQGTTEIIWDKSKDKKTTHGENQTATNNIEIVSDEKFTRTTDIVEANIEKLETLQKGGKMPENAEDANPKENVEVPEKSPQTYPKSTNTLVNPEISDPQPSISIDNTTEKSPVTSQEGEKTLEVGLESTDKEQKPEIIDPQPSTSEVVTEEPEDTDSLGLLAESSRVMVEDDEQELEDEEADDGDDHGYDPDDDEGSGVQTGEHSDESNPPHSEDNIDSRTKAENEDLAESSSESSDKQLRPSILADLLKQPVADMEKAEDGTLLESDVSKQAISFVDLESSSDDETPVTKGRKRVALSVDKKARKVGNKVANADGKPATQGVQNNDKDKSETGEIFNLDSDDDNDLTDDKNDVAIVDSARLNNFCINNDCTSDETVNYHQADRMTVAYYGAVKGRRRLVCQNCLNVVESRTASLVAGIKDFRPLMSLRMVRPTQTLLEISDSDSEKEGEPLGEEAARYLEDNLTDMFNEVWSKYDMDNRLKASEEYLEAELEKMQEPIKEVDRLLRECQENTDKLRSDLYANYKVNREELPGINIYDTPIAWYTCSEAEDELNTTTSLFPLRYPKRRSTSTVDSAAKKLALQQGEKKIMRPNTAQGRNEDNKESYSNENKDVMVIELPTDSEAAALPPLGEMVKPPARVGAQVYAMKNQYGAWLLGTVLDILPKHNETQCRIRFDHKLKNPCKTMSTRYIAYTEPSDVLMTIGTRAIALYKNNENTHKRGDFFYSGVIAEIPNHVNKYRYLVFFDDGYVQYVRHEHTRLVYESKSLVWEEVHPYSRDFVCNYLLKYPERPMVRMHPGQPVNVEWEGKWWDTKVVAVDAALVQVMFPAVKHRTEWIYRGSTRLKPLFSELLAAKRSERARLPRSTMGNAKRNMPYVEYTRCTEPPKPESQTPEDIKRQRSVAKKSTTLAQQITNAAGEASSSKVVFYSPKNSVRPPAMVSHTCGPHCKRSDLLTLKELRTYNPLAKPLLSGWERQIVRHKSFRGVMYRAPCGRRLRNMRELHQYLRAVRSDLPVDLFDFNHNTHCLAEFVLNKSNAQKKDLAQGKEGVPVPCVNVFDNSLPEFCTYNTERNPTKGVPLNLDPAFLCGCDCTDDCQDKSKCACWNLTLEGARTIGMDSPNIGYHYRRLPEPLPSGIYECNSRCKCQSTCFNRVVQNPLQLKLQVFKTLNRGWGIRALNDVPKGAFICIYAGNLLTDATANLDGLNEGDEYLAELDYIEVVEAMKDGYEEDIPASDKELDKKESKKVESEVESESTESEEEEVQNKTDIEDGDFQPGYLGFGITEFNKRLRRRDKKKNKDNEKEEKNSKARQDEEKNDKAKQDEEDDCITISDDEEARVSQREPSRFAAQESMSENKLVPKYKSVRSYFGEDETCFIMDAKVQGNIGRYLNHSCSPNVFVQNVFVDTHDPRFPWVSFFALHHIRAGTELTWNYNYDIGSVPGKVLYCFCGAANCRGRLL